MTEKTARQIEAMKNDYNFGVEVEMNHITRQNAAKVAAEFFGTGRYENTAYRNGYMTWSAYDQTGREWKFSRDVSIAGPDDEKCDYPVRLFILRVTSQTVSNQGFWKN